MESSRQEYWSEMPFPTPGDLPDPGIEPASLSSPALAGGFFTTSTTWEAQLGYFQHQIPAFILWLLSYGAHCCPYMTYSVITPD